MKSRLRLAPVVGVGSALVSAAVALLWARGCAVGDEFRWETHPQDLHKGSLAVQISLVRGHLYCWASAHEAVTQENQTKAERWAAQYGFQRFHHRSGVKVRPLGYARPENEGTTYSLLGFEYHRWRDSPGRYGSVRTVTAVPLWFPLAICGSIAAVCLHRWRTVQRRRRLGHCPGCGYDLTANASGVCPECGGPVPDPAVRECSPPGR